MSLGSSQDADLRNPASACQGAREQEAQGLLAAVAAQPELPKVLLRSVFRRVVATVLGAAIVTFLGAGLWWIRWGLNSRSLRGRFLPKRTGFTELADDGLRIPPDTAELVESLWRMRRNPGSTNTSFREDPGKDFDRLLAQGLDHPIRLPDSVNGGEEKLTDETSFEYRYNMGQCFLTVYQSALVIGIATLDMAAAAKLCKPDENGRVEVSACGGLISDFFSELMTLASYVAIAPSICGLTEFAHSWCASDMFWFLSNVGNVLVSSFSYRGDCWSAEEIEEAEEAENGTGTVDSQLGHVSFHSFTKALRAREQAASTRRVLSTASAAHVAKLPAEEVPEIDSDAGFFRDLDIANCAIMAQQLAANLADLGFNTAGTVEDCKLVAEEEHTELDRQACASDVLNLVGLVSDVAVNVGGLLGACPKEGLHGAWCTSDVATGVGALVNFGAWGAAVTADCDSEVGWAKGPGKPKRLPAEQQGGLSGKTPEERTMELLKAPR
mmetsp:Transcript_91822/g.163417  ORF Transcript_91822/g.163417 Transcript_91822/m.163417 type:complete len:497 (-) Transcript_91822:44-1534(-)